MTVGGGPMTCVNRTDCISGELVFEGIYLFFYAFTCSDVENYNFLAGEESLVLWMKSHFQR